MTLFQDGENHIAVEKGAELVRTIIAGSRNAMRQSVLDAIENSGFSDQITLVISGGAKGADRWGEEWAQSKGVPVQKFIPDWKTHGRSAGILRNTEMAMNADALIAVWVEKSKGTANMIETAQRKGLKIYGHEAYP